MEHWDEVVTDPSISLDRVLRFVEGLGAPALLDDRYFVATTSGTTGLKGAFVYSSDEWISVLASYARANDWAGVPASLTHRLRLAVVSTTVPWHQSAVVGASLKGPLVPTLRLDATSPMEEIVSALNDFQPESLVAYAGMAKALALEQLDGRLRVDPRSVMCASEVLTPGARRVIREAFGSEPYETYAATETAGLASDCLRHRLHLYEDLVIPEIVDDHNRPVPLGTYGSKILVTVLFSRTLLLIRYEISDSVAMSTEACECGLPFGIIDAVRGRREDVLSFDGERGHVLVQPGIFGDSIEGEAGIREWQVAQESRRAVRVRVCHIRAVRSPPARRRIRSSLVEVGVVSPSVIVDDVRSLEQTAVGKTPLVRGL
jgi:phenylacetate-CoA ligase